MQPWHDFLDGALPGFPATSINAKTTWLTHCLEDFAGEFRGAVHACLYITNDDAGGADRPPAGADKNVV